MKTLFSGCSFTADCGFSDKNLSKHWVQLLTQQFDLDAKNIAIGGMSNEEIFQRTVYSIIENKPDFVFVMWSSLDRQWVYFDDSNVDDFSMLQYKAGGELKSGASELILFSKLYYTHFINRYVNLYQWLIYCISLQHILEKEKIDFCFIKGFGNLIKDWLVIDMDNLYLSLSEDIKKILDFDNRTDYYLKEKIKKINLLIAEIDKSKWVNFTTTSFFKMRVDLADDGRHPGEISNKKLVELLTNGKYLYKTN